MVSTHSQFKIDQLSTLDPHSVGFNPLIQRHLAWLADQNSRHNLTAVPPDKWIVRHVLDSIAPLVAGWGTGINLLDLGTGGGFPGVPLALQANLPRFTLLDSKRKVVEGLNEFLNEAGLSARGTALSVRSETLGHQEGFRGSYDRVVVRAVASLPTLIELGIPFLVPEGELWCWKSDLEEVQAAGAALEQLHTRVLRALVYRLPEEDSDRYILALGREGEIPLKYPRREGLPHKRPLL